MKAIEHATNERPWAFDPESPHCKVISYRPDLGEVIILHGLGCKHALPPPPPLVPSREELAVFWLTAQKEVTLAILEDRVLEMKTSPPGEALTITIRIKP